MNLGFHSDVVDFYQRYRRGYPPETIAAIAQHLALTPDDIVLDLGCGTGQLTRPLAARTRKVIGMDPEPDMLARARRESDQHITWMIGADTDIPTLTTLLGEKTVAAVTIGQALHWMDHDTLFRALFTLIRPSGGVAVLTNGTPLWLQDSTWSTALRKHLEHWLGHTMTLTCGSDTQTQQRYNDSLRAAGFTTHLHTFDYTDELDIDQIVGSVYSAMPADKLPPPDQRPAFAAQIHHALQPHAPFHEHVRVTTLIGQVP